MFCSNCGAKVTGGASFCQKCGTKVVQDTVQQPPDVFCPAGEVENTGVNTAIENTTIMSEKETEQIHHDTYKERNNFKAFVDNRIRSTTKFQSAEEFLQKKRMSTFLWFCFGIPAFIGLIAGGPLAALVFGFFFGHAARFIAGGIIRGRYIADTIGRIDSDIDVDDFRQFLNGQLDYLHPYFNECRYAGAGVLEIPFGAKQKSSLLIYIKPDETNPDSGRMKYVFDAKNNPSALSKILSTTMLSLLYINEPKHTCLFKSVPILQAAIEYYIALKQKGEILR